jgi:aminoglycoside 2''-phosphotransferase
VPQLGVNSLRRFEHGWDNHVYELNHSLVAKLSKSSVGGFKLLKEACLLPHLRAELGEIIPRELAKCVVNIDGEECVLLVYEAIRGWVSTQRGMRLTTSTHEVCHMLAQLMEKIHSISPPNECSEMVPVHDTPRKWAEALRSEVFRLIDMAGSTLPSRLRNTILERVVEYAKRLQSLGFTPKLIHGDIDPRNLLVDDTGRLVGLIDWGEAAVGDPAIDYAGLFYVEEHIGKHVLEIQREEYPQYLSPRVGFHRDLAPLYWVAYGASSGNHNLTEAGLRLLRESFPS